MCDATHFHYIALGQYIFRLFNHHHLKVQFHPLFRRRGRHHLRPEFRSALLKLHQGVPSIQLRPEFGIVLLGRNECTAATSPRDELRGEHPPWDDHTAITFYVIYETPNMTERPLLTKESPRREDCVNRGGTTFGDESVIHKFYFPYSNVNINRCYIDGLHGDTCYDMRLYVLPRLQL